MENENTLQQEYAAFLLIRYGNQQLSHAFTHKHTHTHTRAIDFSFFLNTHLSPTSRSFVYRKKKWKTKMKSTWSTMWSNECFEFARLNCRSLGTLRGTLRRRSRRRWSRSTRIIWMTTGGGSRWGCDHHLLPRGVVAEPGGQGIPVLVGIFRSLGVVHGFSPDLLEQLQDVHKILREGVLPSVLCRGSLERMKIELT